MNIKIIPKQKFTPELWAFLETNPITELEEIEYFIFFQDYSGIIFYIPEEGIFGCEIIWHFGSEMLIKFGTYRKYVNQILTELEKEYINYLKLNEELKVSFR